MKKIIININNNQDYNKFTKKIKLYKSIFYYNTNFIVNNNINDKTVDIIINALNIKKRKKRIEYIYYSCCDYLDNNIDYKKICNFKNNKCFVQRKNNSNHCGGCCIGCPLLNKGCLTKNLSCKLLYCRPTKKLVKEQLSKVNNILKLYSIRQRFIVKINFYTTTQDALKNLYSYSLLIPIIKIIHRFNKYVDTTIKKMDKK